MIDKMGVIFQGTKSGLIIALDELQPFPELLCQLKDKLDESGYFFAKAHVTLSLGKRDITENELKTLAEVTAQAHGLRVEGIKTSSAKSAKNAQKLGLQTSLSKILKQKKEKIAAKKSRAGRDFPAQLVRSTIRSGQIFESSGHLIILGDVNHGAEIAAAGDIIVFGALRGNAFAGATGDKRAIVAALYLAPPLLRIDNAVARCQEKKTPTQQAEFAFIENGQIVIDSWSNKNRLSVNNGKL